MTRYRVAGTYADKRHRWETLRADEREIRYRCRACGRETVKAQLTWMLAEKMAAAQNELRAMLARQIFTPSAIFRIGWKAWRPAVSPSLPRGTHSAPLPRCSRTASVPEPRPAPRDVQSVNTDTRLYI